MTHVPPTHLLPIARRLIAMLVVAMCIAPGLAQTTQTTTEPATRPAAAPTGQTWALIVVGDPGSEMYARHYRDRAARFVAVLRKAGVASDRITLLSGDADWRDKPVTAAANAASVLAEMKALAARLESHDRVILILLGHGAASNDSPTLMLPGRDLQAKDLASAMSAIQCRRQTILNFSASAGAMAPLLASPDRINITGAGAGQVNNNDFAEFVLQELENQPASPLLDVYNRATRRFAQWTVRQKLGPDGGWIVEGRESAAIFRKLYDAPDVPVDRKFSPSPASSDEDAADPPLLAEASPHWSSRRVITENPSIADTDGPSKSALTPQGFTPVAPADAPLAAKTPLVPNH